MAKVYADIEHQIEQQELIKFVELAKQLGKDLQETIELCMFEKRDEYLNMFANNVPEESINEHRRATSEIEEGTNQTSVINASGENGVLSKSGDTTP